MLRAGQMALGLSDPFPVAKILGIAPLPKMREIVPFVNTRLRILINVQESHCAICGEFLDGNQEKSVSGVVNLLYPTIEHVIPRALDGRMGWGNIVAAHYGCNSAKANRLPTGCELIWLLAVNARTNSQPQVF